MKNKTIHKWICFSINEIDAHYTNAVLNECIEVFVY
jgi:hypothetical protein